MKLRGVGEPGKLSMGESVRKRDKQPGVVWGRIYKTTWILRMLTIMMLQGIFSTFITFKLRVYYAQKYLWLI